MKKTLSILIAVALVITLFGCNTGNQTESSADKINVVTTIFPQYDFTRQIAQDKAELTLLLSPGGETHTYEPTPKDIIKIEKSDLFIYVGGESDVWVDDILKNTDTSKTTVIKLMDCIEPIEEEEGDSHAEHDENEEGHTVEYDEHVWTSPKNAISISRAISDALCKIDSANADMYKENEEKYISALTELDNRFADIVKNGNKDTVVFGDRFPFLYFTKEYGLKHYAAFPGCSSETEPSAATMAELINAVKNNDIPVVFYLEMSNQKVADSICESTNAKKLQFHSCQTVTKDEFERGETYISLMQRNADNLEEALK